MTRDHQVLCAEPRTAVAHARQSPTLAAFMEQLATELARSAPEPHSPEVQQ